MAAVSPAGDLLKAARRVVVKVGSALVVDGETGEPNRALLSALAQDAARLAARGQQILVVSSGAVALGRRRLGLGRRPLDLPQKQAAAAAGQSLLMRAWEEAFEPAGLVCAQVLLTRDDTEVRRRWLNGKATLDTLMDLGVAPIINENDTVATEEIRYGDNDRLAARVAQMIGADLLVLLSDVDGLYTADPRVDPSARRLDVVSELTEEIEAMAGASNAAAGMGVGGMGAKLAAVRIARGAGCATVITLGGRPEPLLAVEAGAACTLFEPSLTPTAAYKQWIAGSLSAQGAVTVDAGAVAALKAGKSLLPAGVRKVEGRFGKGDAVLVLDPAGREVARGLSRYDAAEAEKIMGLRSDAIEAALGYTEGPTLIHADDMALAARSPSARAQNPLPSGERAG